MFSSAGVAGFRLGLGILVCISRCTIQAGESLPPQGVRPEAAYQAPDALTAVIFGSDTSTNQPLFRFKRSATHEPAALTVVGEYFYPDGKPAVRERAFYHDDLLTRYEVEDYQTGASGSATLEHDPHNPAKGTIVFRYSKDASSRANVSTRTEQLQPDTLINDMVGPFLASNWDRLDRGEKVSCRCVVVSRRETIAFTFSKESDQQRGGRKVAIVKMEPSNLLFSLFVEPLRFVIEKDSPHRVLQYAGRTAPKKMQHGQWKDLDAVTVFNW